MDINELTELIHTGAKQVRDKISIHLRKLDKNRKPPWEMRIEVQIKKLLQVKLQRKKKLIRIHGNVKTKTRN